MYNQQIIQTIKMTHVRSRKCRRSHNNRTRRTRARRGGRGCKMCNKQYDDGKEFPKGVYDFCNACATNGKHFSWSPHKYVAPIDREPTHKTCFGCLKTVKYTKGDFCADCNSKSVEELWRIRSKALAKHSASKAASPKASPKASPRRQ